MTGWFHEWYERDCSLTHYTRTLELTQRLQSPPGSAVGPGRPARRLGAAGSTTNRRPDLERGPSRASVHTEAWARRTARAPARRHATAARCRLAAIKNSFQRSVQWSPAMHREQPVGGLRGGSARRAGGGCSTCLVDGATWRGRASTATMVPKDCSHWSRPRAAHLPAHQRSRWMDGASHVWGKDPVRARGRSARARLQWQAQARWPCHSSLRSGGRLSA